MVEWSQGMKIKSDKRLVLLIAIIIASVPIIGAAYKTLIVEAASSGDVIINEIMYNPAGPDEDLEYLELYNTTASPINMENWCFSAGIILVTSYSDTACFDVGTTIPANGYLLVSPNPTKTNTTYAQTAAASYAGSNLSNGGETVTLIDENDAVIDTVTYIDNNPWPAAPDGDGPSLELKNPANDNSVAINWGASVGNPTPKAENSWLSLELPEITNVTDPNDVAAGSAVNISADLVDEDTVQLEYKVNFDTAVTIPMYDDGLHNDGSASDGRYGATVPAQTAGKLVRFKIIATNVDGTISSPSEDDSVDYRGYTVQDESVTSNIPILQWYMPDSEYTDMVTNHSFDDVEFDCIIAYDNQVYDNVKVWVKGGVSRNFPKKSLAMDLPAGYPLQIDGLTDRAVDEFHLNAEFFDSSGSRVSMAWQIAEEQGLDVPDVFKVRMQQNGSFFGVYSFLEEYDDTWREAFGYANGAFYKVNTLKTNVNIDPSADLQTFSDNLNVPPSDARRQYAIDNLDIPNFINYMAFMALIRNWEWHNGKNLMKYHDINNTGRWRMLPQDIDGMMQDSGFDGQRIINLMTPYDTNGYEMPDRSQRFQFMALYAEEDFREMYFRRLRTMLDEYYTNDRFLAMYQDQLAELGDDIVADHEKWSTINSISYNESNFESIFRDMKQNMLLRFRKPWAVPLPQSSNPVVEFDVINASPGNQDDEYIRLANNTSESIDISSWTIPELNYTIPSGSVLLAGDTAYLVKKDMAYKTANPGTYILGQYTNSVNDNPSNELTLLRSNSSESDGQGY